MPRRRRRKTGRPAKKDLETLPIRVSAPVKIPPRVPGVDPLADPTSALGCDAQHHLDDRYDDGGGGLWTFDTTCAAGEAELDPAHELEAIDATQRRLFRFLEDVALDLEVLRDYGSRFQAKVAFELSRPVRGPRIRALLQRALTDLLQAHDAIQQELLFCAGQNKDARNIVRVAPRRAGEVRANMHFVGCSRRLNERLLAAIKVLYHKRWRRVQDILQKLVTGYDYQAAKNEYDLQGSTSFGVFGKLSKAIRYRLQGARSTLNYAIGGEPLEAAKNMGKLLAWYIVSYASKKLVGGAFDLIPGASLCRLVQDAQLLNATAGEVRRQLKAYPHGEMPIMVRNVIDGWVRTASRTDKYYSAVHRSRLSDASRATMRSGKQAATQAASGLLMELFDSFLEYLTWWPVKQAATACSGAQGFVSYLLQNLMQSGSPLATAVGLGSRLAAEVSGEWDEALGAALFDLNASIPSEKVPDADESTLRYLIRLPGRAVATVMTPIHDDLEARAGKLYTGVDAVDPTVQSGAAALLTSFVIISLMAFATQTGAEDLIELDTEEDEAMVAALVAAHGPALEQSLRRYGRINPVANPATVFQRCTEVMKGTPEECMQLVADASAYTCHDRDCTAPDTVPRTNWPEPRRSITME